MEDQNQRSLYKLFPYIYCFSVGDVTKLSNYSAVSQIRTDAAMESLVVFYVLPWTMIELKTQVLTEFLFSS